jgi:hypothetical protein
MVRSSSFVRRWDVIVPPIAAPGIRHFFKHSSAGKVPAGSGIVAVFEGPRVLLILRVEEWRGVC